MEKYTSSLIPPREAPTKAVQPEKTDIIKSVSFNDADFAEIEYETLSGSTGKTDGLFSSPLAQPIGPRTTNPIRERFYTMRRLASDNPFARNDAGLFYKQAKFMEDFLDDYPENAPFSMYYPYYQHMGYEQLRTYFTWRSKVRSDEYSPISSSYIFLYIYELLSGIGVSNPVEGLNKLIAIWNAYQDQGSEINRYLLGWLKDYHIYYILPHHFVDFVKEYSLQNHYSELFLFETNIENSLDLWNDISNYKITKSKFYTSGNDLLLRNCFNKVLDDLRSYCIDRNIRIEDLFVYEISKKLTWYPFRQALFYSRLRQPDRKVEISSQEIYYCQNNRWTADIAIHHSGRAVLIGYIIKKMEVCLRQAVKYKFKNTVDPKDVNRSFQKLKVLGIQLTELDQVIESSVAAFYRDINRTIVTVDRGNLARIREEALGTQDMLIVPEANTAVPLPVEPYISSPLELQMSSISDGWSAFKTALSLTELHALKILLEGDTAISIKTFADENSIMLEVLADGINEKAADYIGDNLLDDDISIYEEYTEKIMELVGQI